jgi:hypothetical protein
MSSVPGVVLRCWLLLLAVLPAWAVGQSIPEAAANDDGRKVVETFDGRGQRKDGSKPRTPAEAVATFKVREGLTVDGIAPEPAD